MTSSATLALDLDEDVFRGHYPGLPIFPGVCVIECAHRSCLATAPDPTQALRLDTVESARFLSPAFPGDVLTVTVNWQPIPDGWRCAAEVHTQAGKVASTRLRYRTSSDSTVAEVARPSAPGRAAGTLTLHPAEIQRLLPHRHPMLLLDRVTEVDPGAQISAIKAISYAETWYAGRSNGNAEQLAYPPVLLLESWSQAAGLLMSWERPNPDINSGVVMLFGAVADVRFHRPVFPGDVVGHRARVGRAVDGAAVFEGESAVAGQVTLTVGRAVIALRPAAALRRPEPQP